MSSSYNKQTKWREITLKNAVREKAERDHQTTKNLSFAPTLVSTSNARNNENQTSKSMENKESKSYAGLHFKPREGKDDIQTRLAWKSIQESPAYQNLGAFDRSELANDFEYQHMDRSQYLTSPEIQKSHTSHEYRANNFVPYHEEPIVEVLERERREWKEERTKLEYFLHLQQIQLNERSIAAHERAEIIAKEFAKTIETFEERLLKVEESVLREITAIKSIAESLRTSVVALQSTNHMHHS